MRRTKKWFWGLFSQDILVTVSNDLRWIEIEESFMFLHWKIKEESKEVYLPKMEKVSTENLRVIAEAYLELHEVAKEVKRLYG